MFTLLLSLGLFLEEDEPPPLPERTVVVREVKPADYKWNIAKEKPPAIRRTPHFTGNAADIIREMAAKYGVDANLMLKIAKCESGLNPSAKNKNSTASGLFQFISSTWNGTPEGRAGLSPFDPYANAEAAARKISQGGISAWHSSQYCWK